MDLRRDPPPGDLHAVGVRPALGTFGIADAYIVAGGDPSRSTLYYRMAKSGHGRMPYVGSSLIDREGLALVAAWIESLPPSPDASGGRAAERDLLRRLRAGEAVAGQLLSTSSGALDLVRALDEGGLPEPVRADVLDRAMRAPETQRGLFERFVPPELRPKRLGTKPDPAGILAVPGDAGRGRRLFFESTGLQCRNCHEVEGRGENYGPDLSKIGAKYGRAALLETILSPSKQIDPKYATWTVQGADGAVHTGLLLEQGDRGLLLKDASRKEIRIPAASLLRMKAQETSAMPEFLLQDLRAEEASDLLEFLAGLR